MSETKNIIEIVFGDENSPRFILAEVLDLAVRLGAVSARIVDEPKSADVPNVETENKLLKLIQDEEFAKESLRTIMTFGQGWGRKAIAAYRAALLKAYTEQRDDAEPNVDTMLEELLDWYGSVKINAPPMYDIRGQLRPGAGTVIDLSKWGELRAVLRAAWQAWRTLNTPLRERSNPSLEQEGR